MPLGTHERCRVYGSRDYFIVCELNGSHNYELWGSVSLRGFPGGASGKEPACPCGRQKRRSGKEPACPCGRQKRREFNPWDRKIPWRRKWQPTPVFSPGKSHGLRSLAGGSPWGRKDGVTEHACTHSLHRQLTQPKSKHTGQNAQMKNI